MAQQLNFTDRQAQAILEMRLYKLIGLEIEALMKEHDETLENIAKYEDILEHRSSMAKVIIKELTAFKKAYGKERKTVIDNLKEAVVAAKKIEEQDVVFLMGTSDMQRLWILLSMREIKRRQTQNTGISLRAKIRIKSVFLRTRTDASAKSA